MNHFWPRTLVFLFAFALAAAPDLAATSMAEEGPAQESASTSPSAVETRIELLGALDATLAELGALDASAADQDKRALETRMYAVRIERVMVVHELAELVLADETEDEDRARARAVVQNDLSRTGVGILEYIDKMDRRIADTNERVAKASGGEALAVAQEATQLSERADTAYRLLARNLELARELDMVDGTLRDQAVARLKRRAALAAARIDLASNTRALAQARVAKSPDDADAKAALAVADERKGAAVAALRTTISLMKAADFDATGYQQKLIEATGEVDAESLSLDVVAGVVKKWARDGRTAIAENGLNIVFKIVLFVALIAGFRVLAAAARRIVRRALDSSRLQVSALLRSMTVKWTGSVVMLIGILVALSQLGISVGPLLAGLGIAGFIIGFALQDTLSNFASGMMILLYRPFDVGDVIEAAGVLGKVSQMNLVSTTILTGDHQTLVVPNTKIWGDVIRNITAQSTRRVDLVFGIGYGDDIEHAARVLKEVVTSHEKVLDDPPPVVEVSALGESSVDFIVRPWVNTEDYWRVYWDLTRAVKQRFDAEGISIPFPQRDLHIIGEVPKEGKAAEGYEDRRESA